MLPGWDEQALLEEVFVPPRRAFLPLPDLRVVERPGWMQIITPSLKQGAMNEVVLSVLDPGEADAVIDATIAEYRGLGLRFRWSVTPDSMPTDLGERLARRGLTSLGVVAMARLTRDPPAQMRGSIDVEEIGPARVDDYTLTLGRAWQCDPEPWLLLNRLCVERPERGQHLYLASYAGQPGATAAYFAFARSAYLVGGAVDPALRGKGLYHALVGARLRDAAARGLSLCTCHAMEDTSAPLLAHMGFVSVCRYTMFHG